MTTRTNECKTVRVRIAVAVDTKGKWSACGWKSDGKQYDKEARDSAIDGLYNDGSYNVHWIEADVPVPQETMIEGTATPAEGG